MTHILKAIPWENKILKEIVFLGYLVCPSIYIDKIYASTVSCLKSKVDNTIAVNEICNNILVL